MKREQKILILIFIENVDIVVNVYVIKEKKLG